MSFSQVEILEDFAEASRYGRRDRVYNHDQMFDKRWWYERGFKKERPVYEISADPRFRNLPREYGGGPPLPSIQRSPAPTIRPVAVLRFSCDVCGGTYEQREGTNRSFHVGLHDSPLSKLCTRMIVR